jgi:serine/threonine protein kinase
LPREFARDPERLARFRREARTLASLNHPNIAAIYGLEESGDVDCLVMELVEGETLAARLQKGRLPMAIVLRYGAEVADALSAVRCVITLSWVRAIALPGKGSFGLQLQSWAFNLLTSP